jgi:hypothetical protein
MSSEFQCRLSVIEPLEQRRMLSGGTENTPTASLFSPAAASVTADNADVTPPSVVGVRILGTSRETSAVMVTFSEPLDVARAQQVDNFKISRKQSNDDSGFFSNPFDDGKSEGRQTIKIDTATYDDATRTVTLVPHEAFNGVKRFRRLRIDASAGTGVADVAGNLLDGDENGEAGERAFYKLRFKESRSVSYKEGDGDRVKLQVTGPGTMSVLQRLDAHKHMIGGAAQVILSDDTSSSTVLSGKVKAGHASDGVATIDVVSNAGEATIAIAQDPAFAIGAIEP